MPHKANHLVYVPRIGHCTDARIRRGLRGRGVGNLLLDGGMGTGHSYEGVQEYQKVTNAVVGSGLSKTITDKLEKLEIKDLPKSKKPRNIQFSL
jgi:hypothetical protein